MDTGKVEYAPDYESNKFSDFFREQVKNPEFAAAYLKVDKEENSKLQDVLRREWEHQRLKEAVVQAAKAWKLKADDGDNEKWSVHYVAMCEAIDALITFETEHGIDSNS